ncbi:uncharacterized protein LOC106078306 isoform X1 [Biomphalaria glabrata]|uniref:Uncharacterized protein LOC106078306 isoform X1 n=1 Tax=Biomphalaria glabrata TaxID=6526 RepID=A0A9W2ZTV8_BIOGL|nr:uncharacterized protein LOC106078306 isoform X1 [Biomphalaria glabrata]KAI8740454.1 hypothetical protein BgiMline_023544 [Biomphalaria glabrata]
MNIFIFCLHLLCLMRTTLGLYLLGLPGYNLNNYPDPKPDPEKCRQNPGFQIYRHKNVQMCLKFQMFDTPLTYNQVQRYCDDRLAIIGVFDLKEKLEILQQQTRCVWVNFKLDRFDIMNFVFSYRIFKEAYSHEKHRNLFYKDYSQQTKYEYRDDAIRKLATCGIYHPSYRLLAMDNCFFPGLYEPNCAFGVVCEDYFFTRDNL